MQLYNTTVAVTGGNDGLGLALVKLLSTICKKIYVIDRSEECKALNIIDNVEYIQCDLLKGNVQPLEVDYFISNVGMTVGPKLFKDYSSTDIRNMVRLNISVHLWCFKNMVFRKFVFIDSVMSFVGVEYYSMYCACKSLIRYFNQSLIKEGFDTLIVYPYKINTNMFKEIKDFGTLEADEVAKSIKKAIEDDTKEVFLPPVFRFLKKFTQIVPGFIKNTLLNQVVKYFIDERSIKKNKVEDNTVVVTLE